MEASSSSFTDESSRFAGKSSFLTDEKVVPRVMTTVAGTYLVNAPPGSTGVQRSAAAGRPESKVFALQGEVSEASLTAASAVERVLDQLGDSADRIVRSRSGGIAFLFFAGPRYAMLESDDDGSTVALLSDRATDTEAETWVVDPDGLTSAVRKIRSFLGAPRGAYP